MGVCDGGLRWRLGLIRSWRAGYCCLVSSLSYIKQTFHNSLVLSNCILPGGRLDPSRVRIVDVFDTHNDPFASNIRQGRAPDLLYPDLDIDPDPLYVPVPP